jgi:hypothetical protein
MTGIFRRESNSDRILRALRRESSSVCPLARERLLHPDPDFEFKIPPLLRNRHQTSAERTAKQELVDLTANSKFCEE